MDDAQFRMNSYRSLLRNYEEGKLSVAQVDSTLDAVDIGIVKDGYGAPKRTGKTYELYYKPQPHVTITVDPYEV